MIYCWRKTTFCELSARWRYKRSDKKMNRILTHNKIQRKCRAIGDARARIFPAYLEVGEKFATRGSADLTAFYLDLRK